MHQATIHLPYHLGHVAPHGMVCAVGGLLLGTVSGKLSCQWPLQYLHLSINTLHFKTRSPRRKCMPSATTTGTIPTALSTAGICYNESRFFHQVPFLRDKKTISYILHTPCLSPQQKPELQGSSITQGAASVV